MYVADRDRNVILVAHRDSSRFSRAFGSAGDGPGEFGRAQSVSRNATHILVDDPWSRGVHFFDAQFERVDFVGTGTGLGSRSEAASGTLFIAAPDSSTHLIDVRESEPPFRITKSVLPRLTDFEDPARLYNGAILATNDVGQLVAAYNGIPVLLLLDERQELREAIRFVGGELPDPNTTEPGGFGTYRIYTWPHGIGHSDNGRIALATPRGVYLLEKLDGIYRFTRKLSLKTETGTERLLFDLEFDGEERLYTVSPREGLVLRFVIDAGN